MDIEDHNPSIIENLRRQLAEKDAQIARLSSLLQTDPMTSIFNRAGLLDRFTAQISQQARTGGSMFTVFIDVDDFKRLNTDFGHAGGDHALIVIAERLKATMRQYDVVARWSGDEFVVTFHLTEDEVENNVQLKIIERMVASVRAPIVFNGRPMNVTCSFGVVQWSERQQINPENLINAANKAMFNAKLFGKNTAVTEPFKLRA